MTYSDHIDATIVDLIEAAGEATVAELCHEIGLSAENVEASVRRLVNAGTVETYDGFLHTLALPS